MYSNLVRASRQRLGLKKPCVHSGEGVHRGRSLSERLVLRGNGKVSATDMYDDIVKQGGV